MNDILLDIYYFHIKIGFLIFRVLYYEYFLSNKIGNSYIKDLIQKKDSIKN